MMRPFSCATFACALPLVLAACHHEPGEAQPAEAKAAQAAEPAEGIVLGAEEREHLGLKLAPLASASARDELELAGRAIEDPAQRFVLRAPQGGTLVANGAWPELGSTLEGGSVPGSIAPRLSTAERLDLAARSAQARADAAAAGEELASAERELARASKLNAADKSVSDKALEEAEARAKLARVRRESAAGEQQRLETALAGGEAALAPIALHLAEGGEVREVFARPGEALEAGAPILEILRRAAPLAELELPLGAAPQVHALRVEPLAQPGRWIQAQVIARRAGAGGNLALVARLAGEASDLRSGEALVARAATSATAIDGVLLPASAVVRTAGRAWCWVAHGDAQLVREPVELAHPVSGGWVLGEGWARGASVVVEGAQALLSLELLGNEKGASAGD